MIREKTLSWLKIKHNDSNCFIQRNPYLIHEELKIPIVTLDSQFGWKEFELPITEFRPSLCLLTGQTFSWKRVTAPYPGIITQNSKDHNFCKTENVLEIKVKTEVEVINDGIFEGKLQQHVKDEKKVVPMYWIGVLGSSVIHLCETETSVMYRVLSEDKESGIQRLREFVRMGQRLSELEKRCGFNYLIKQVVYWCHSMDEFLSWMKSESIYEKQPLTELLKKSSGMRLVKLDPIEALFSFIISANNNIPRITLLVDILRQRFGSPLIATVGHSVPLLSNLKAQECMNHLTTSAIFESANENEVNFQVAPPPPVYVFFQFPSIQALAHASVPELRELCFGYRAFSIVTAAKQLVSNASSWMSKAENPVKREIETTALIASESEAMLQNNDAHVKKNIHQYLAHLANLPRLECSAELEKLRGVGRKVADCVALLSLDQLESVPVDTHVWKIACRLNPELKATKSLSRGIYEEVGNLFRARYQPYAGWAVTNLFRAELESGRGSKVPLARKRHQNKLRPIA